MRVLGIEVSRRKKQKEPLKVMRKQPKTLILGISEHLERQPHWPVKLFHRHGAKYSPISEMTVRDFAQICAEVEAYIREQFGAGDFRVSIYNPSGDEVASYEVPVGGPKAYRSSAGNIGAGDSESKGGRSGGKVSDFMEAATFAKEMSGGDKILDILLKQMELNAAPPPPDPFKDQLLTTLYNNQITEKESAFTVASQIIEMANQLKPTVPAEDSTVAMVTAFAPLLGNLLSARGLSAPVLPGGALDVQGLREALRGLSPAEVAQLSTSDQAALTAFTGAGDPNAPSLLPRPGAAPVSSTAPGGAPPGLASASTSGATPPSPQANPDHLLIDSVIQRLRDDIRNGEQDDQIAHRMIGLFAVAQACTGDPHPMMTGILKADTQEAQSSEFVRFCAAIPELSREPARIETIGVELMRLMRGAVEAEAGAEQAPDSPQFADPSEQVISDETIEPETQEGQTDGPESPGPARIRDESAEPGTPEAVKDSADNGAARPEPEEQAQAV